MSQYDESHEAMVKRVLGILLADWRGLVLAEHYGGMMSQLHAAGVDTRHVYAEMAMGEHEDVIAHTYNEFVVERINKICVDVMHQARLEVESGRPRVV